MPVLHLKDRSGGPDREFRIHKTITTIGPCRENDVCLACDEGPGGKPVSGRGQASTLASIILEDGVWHIQPESRKVPLLINGKKSKQASLRNNDIIQVGDSTMVFSFPAETQSPRQRPSPDGGGDDLESDAQVCTSCTVDHYQQLFNFSLRLLGRYDLEGVLEGLLDSVVDITGADKGFLLITAGERPKVAAARSARQENIKDPETLLSEMIIQRAILEKKPLIVADAFNDEEFNASESVLSLKPHSVMCVPLMDQGSLMGILYVGNDSVANHFQESSLEIVTVFAAQASLILRNALLMNELRLDNIALRARLQDQQFGDIIGSCEGMKAIFRKVERLAGTDISILITGETGTGKELIAREMHRRSNRSKGPFITINCGAIPENLLESEFFGHVRGAFTGANVTRTGKFQAANNGTLFLDEIGEMNLSLQVKILRAIQEKVITKVGDTRAEPVDIRILAATNKDLQEEVLAGRFREDLYYRLNVVAMHLPPLRERGDDIMVIARYFLDKLNKEFNRQIKGFNSTAMAAIKAYHWPGNIRQLENKLKRAVLLADKPLISLEDLDLEPELLRPVTSLGDAKDQFQRRYINEVLARNNGNRAKTAKDLQVDPRTIFRHLEKERTHTPGSRDLWPDGGDG